MQHDRSVKSCVEQINAQAQEFLDFVNSNNQCAYTDRIVENILKTAEKLDKVYNSNFENMEIKQEENLTVDDRREKSFEEAMIPTQEVAAYQKEIEPMVTRFFMNDDIEVYSDNHEWRIAYCGGYNFAGEIYYNDKPVCQIMNTISGYEINPAYIEVDFVAKYAEKALKELGFEVKTNCKYYDENEELDLTGERRGRS